MSQNSGKTSLPYWDSNPDPSAVQPVASRFTDCATAALYRHSSNSLRCKFPILNFNRISIGFQPDTGSQTGKRGEFESVNKA
jgi:hypothetical protein